MDKISGYDSITDTTKAVTPETSPDFTSCCRIPSEEIRFEIRKLAVSIGVVTYIKEKYNIRVTSHKYLCICVLSLEQPKTYVF